MRTLSEYLDERQIDEGLGSWLGKLFGTGTGTIEKFTDKLASRIEKFGTDFENAFNAAELAAIKSDDKDLQTAEKEHVKAASKGEDEQYEWLKNKCKEIKDNPDDIKGDTSAALYISWIRELNIMAYKRKDDEGMKLAKEIAKIIDEKAPKSKDEYKKLEEKAKKAAEEKSKNEPPPLPKPEEATEEVIDANEDIIDPLIKSFNGKIDKQKLIDNVQVLLAESEYMKSLKRAQKEGKVDDVELSNRMYANIMGMSVMLCGSMMMSSPSALDKLCEYLGTNKKKLVNAIGVKKLNLNKDEEKK